MFRFWSSDPREDDAAEARRTMDFSDARQAPDAHQGSLKRKVFASDESSEDERETGVKKARVDLNVTTPPETPAVPRSEYFSSQSPAPKAARNTDRIVEVINMQFGTEILMKHKELRFINQELAKCQIALEQLRRCHLIPYPTTCPTPQQMLDIADGKIPAAQSKAGVPTPQWAPPYGVVDGPYARHYAKWLIPDPKFDGLLPEWQGLATMSSQAMEGRTTRNSVSEGATIGKRVARGQTGQKPAPVYPPPKAKTPCTLKRSDGITVKLVCNFCNPSRENFNSTQGFINHCRIAHRKEFKSHEEAAVHCGVPITVSETGTLGVEEKPVAPTAPGIVHPLARPDATAEQNAYATISQRIDESLRLFHEGKLYQEGKQITQIPGALVPSADAPTDKKPSKSFVGSSVTPFLSQLLQSRNYQGSLASRIEDAKTKMDVDKFWSDDDESDEGEQLPHSKMPESVPTNATSSGARVPAMRMPARALPAASAPESRPSSSKGRSPSLFLASSASTLPPTGATSDADASNFDESDEMEIGRSPNTATSITAPSLVSDDGGDESDDGSTSEASDSDSDMPDVSIEYPEIQEVLGQHSAATSSGVRMKKDEEKHVTFVTTPVSGKAAVRRKPRM